MNDKEWEAFSQFAIDHYREAARIAMAVRDAQRIPFGAAEDYNVALFTGVLDKTASPLVYLKDAWRDSRQKNACHIIPRLTGRKLRLEGKSSQLRRLPNLRENSSTPNKEKP